VRRRRAGRGGVGCARRRLGCGRMGLRGVVHRVVGRLGGVAGLVLGSVQKAGLRVVAVVTAWRGGGCVSIATVCHEAV